MRINKFKYTLDFEGWDVKTFGEKELVQAFLLRFKTFLKMINASYRIGMKKKGNIDKGLFI